MIQDSNWFTKNLDKLYKMRIVEIETELDEKIVFDDSSLPGTPTLGLSGDLSGDLSGEEENVDDADGYVENLENVISEGEWETEEENEVENEENEDSKSGSSSDTNSIISLNGSFDIDTQINKVYYCQFKRFPFNL